MRDFWYMLGVVAIGFAINYGLRALPFLLFGGRDRELPKWVEGFGNVVSPVIIAGLVVYSYTGLEWKTAWPYLAGALTVGLQVWRRNPLVSIVAGTVLYMTLLNCGCASQRMVELDARDPSFRMTTQGVLFGDEYVPIEEVPEILEDCDIPHDRVVHILLDPGVTDLRPARTLMGYLSRAGYTRPVLVTKRHAESINLGKKKNPSVRTGTPSVSATRKSIRYKKASE